MPLRCCDVEDEMVAWQVDGWLGIDVDCKQDPDVGANNCTAEHILAGSFRLQSRAAMHWREQILDDP